MKKYEDIIEYSLEHIEHIAETRANYIRKLGSYPIFDPTEKVARLLKGAVDIHCHCGPCVTAIRRSEIDYAKRATEAGMGAIVLKGINEATARSAIVDQKIIDIWAKERNLKPCKILGGVTLCYSVGGLNVDAVINAAQLGGKFIWTPVLDASHHRIIHGTVETLGRGIDVLDKNDDVVPELMEIFKVAADYDLVLTLSHQNTKERLIMVDAARELGVKRIGLVHVFNYTVRLDIEQMEMFIKKGCYLEHHFRDLAPSAWRWDETLEAFKRLGVDRFILASDLGNWRAPDPLDMYKITLGFLLEYGVPEADIEKLVKLNAEKLIWGDP
ncbi:DUF6282 family protein [Chloroflexota bacterium]